MVNGQPKGWSRRTSEVGKGILKVPGAPEAKLRMQVVNRITALMIIFELFLCLSGSIEKNWRQSRLIQTKILLLTENILLTITKKNPC
jgi:hypothetical protein